MQIRPRTWCALFSGLMLWNGCNFVAPAQASEGRHALAMHGEPALPEDFSHLPYVDPAAPKGGLQLLVAGSATELFTSVRRPVLSS